MLPSSPASLVRALAVLVMVAVTGCVGDALPYANNARAEGQSLYQKGDYVNAAAAFTNATRQDPRDYRSFYYLGSCYQATGDYQQAIGAYRSCEAIRPMTLAGRQDAATRYQVMDNLAQCLAKSRTGSADEVADIERRSAADGPNVDDVWMTAKIHRYSGDADAAIETYTKATLLDPKRFDIAKEAGLYEEGLGQTKQAATTLKMAYAVNPNDEQVNAALRRLGVVLGPSLRDPSDLSHI